MNQLQDVLDQDLDPVETREWIESLTAVINADGPERAHYLMERMVDETRRAGGHIPFAPTTAYVNTIPPQAEAKSPGDAALEWRIRCILRWNAMAMVVRANRKPGELGGHISSFASSATLYDVGFNHFWRAPHSGHPGDLLYIQGHSSPGIYARSFLEGRLNEGQIDNYRSEVDGRGISSYPHPWLMPDFWQTPTVSMGLGPIGAIYQARFFKYLEHRGLLPETDRKVWCFMGDGESDEPESLGAISLGGRERLDNLVFVINCNLQRLDGPVRGNGKIIQELEGVFRGAGWNVLKVVWGSYWDPLLARDGSGALRRLMLETLDGEYQNYKAFGGAYTREHFFGKYPETKALVANLSDEDIAHLNRGGHDPHKVYAAYHAATQHKGQPTVILAKTVKGYGMGEAGEAMNITHQQKKMDTAAIRSFRDRFKVPVPDDQLEDVPFFHPGPESPEVKYMLERRNALGGALPQRRRKADESFAVPGIESFERLLKSSGEREISTTMAFVQTLNIVLRDKQVGPRVVPIVADEARTFGMEGLFRQIGIYAPFGQLYRPVDADQLMYYREDAAGQVLQEGITEAGAMCSWLAAATSYSTNNLPMLPFFIFYSMFGMQRIGDLAWAAGDMRARGFLLGATAGRTTLNGEGLQHEDGHSHLLSGAIPNCISYDPTFAFEVAVILQDGMRRMLTDQEDVFYYITLMNENYAHPEMPADAREGIIKGMYLLRDADAPLPAGAPTATAPIDEPGKDAPVVSDGDAPPPKAGQASPGETVKAAARAPRVEPKAKTPKGGEIRAQLMGSGTILREVIAAAELLERDFGVKCDIWSCPSITELRRDGVDVERWNRLHPEETPRTAWITKCFAERGPGVVVAATDYVRAYTEQVRAYLPKGTHFVALGTDGFGRSDTRANLRRFFEVDRYWIAHATVAALADEGKLMRAHITKAIHLYNLDPNKPNPTTV